MEEQLIKEIQFHVGRAAYFRPLRPEQAFGWDTDAMARESEARVKSAKELLASLIKKGQ